MGLESGLIGCCSVFNSSETAGQYYNLSDNMDRCLCMTIDLVRWTNRSIGVDQTIAVQTNLGSIKSCITARAYIF